MKIVFAVCGSFCNHKNALNALKELISAGHDVTPVLSEIVCNTDTRFGTKDTFILNTETLCGKRVIAGIKEAEEILTPKQYDLLIICPCTGNTLAKIANGITDSTVAMTAKIFFRNRKPVLIALATNDALGMTLRNIGTLAVRKNVYFVPLAQDDCLKKPDSLVCDFKQIIVSAENAVQGIQTQPCIE
ncbi:MAG: dipicolinate synthase subunit B [Ruminococcaceae bacterium]|nr:dipicolinate synthase subunit B [Oscillospiraceae bacterium]MBQ3597880.1 dipicolinate synthase subunit B [Clostridia bacterium]MBR2914784.1 dipicolinate synthase subunit B [Clostridia bacterium]